jgi:hypothetical protein
MKKINGIENDEFNDIYEYSELEKDNLMDYDEIIRQEESWRERLLDAWIDEFEY